MLKGEFGRVRFAIGEAISDTDGKARKTIFPLHFLSFTLCDIFAAPNIRRAKRDNEGDIPRERVKNVMYAWAPI